MSPTVEAPQGNPCELHVITICCEFTEETFEEAADNYGIEVDAADLSPEEYGEELQSCVLAHLESETTVVGTTAGGSVVYVQF